MPRGMMISGGAFLLLWGGLEAAEALGLVAENAVRAWPFFLVLVGAALLYAAWTRNDWFAWMEDDERARR